MRIKRLNLFALVASILQFNNPSTASTTFTQADSFGHEGDSKIIPVYISSDDGALAAQFDVYFDPLKVSVGKIEEGTAFYDHSLDVDELDSGIWRVSILSNTNSPFADGALVRVNVGYLTDVPEGEDAFRIENVLLVDNQVNLLEFEELSPVGSPKITNIEAVAVGNKVDFMVELESAEDASYYWDFGDGVSGIGKTVSHTYGHSGNFEVTVTVSNLISSESASAMVNVGKGSGTVVITNLQQSADGYPKTVTVTTDPPGLNHTVTYNGSNQAPTKTGTYRVEVIISDPDYEGTSVAILSVKNWLDSVKEGKVNLGRGWKKVDWFGVLYGGGGDWLYHVDFGWIFPRSSSPDSLWMYWPEGDWFWTSRETFPWLYRSTHEDVGPGWIYYLEGSRAPNLLFDSNIGEWKKRFE